MKITQTQLESLYTFTRQHYVEYYDLQTELVDHLAHNIEAIWEKNPKLSFNEARDLSFKSFGVFGFMNVVESRQKTMNKRYGKILWNFGKEWFTLPKIMLTISLFLVFLLCFSSVYVSYFIYGFTFCIGSYVIIKTLHLRRQLKKRKLETGRIWMLEELIFKAAAINILFVFIHIRPPFTQSVETNSVFPIVFALFFTLVLIYSYISINVLPNQSEKLLSAVYPEYKMV